MLTIVIPTLWRAARMAAVAANAHAATASEHEILFVTEPADSASCGAAAALAAAGQCRWLPNARKASPAGALNTALAALLPGGPGDVMFTGADDLDFRPGWDTAALALMGGGIEVVGTNDLHNTYVVAGTHATHFLVSLAYLRDVGGVPDQPPGTGFCEAYSHGFLDAEFIDVAKARGVFAPCLAAVVEHLHFTFPLPNAFPGDETYRRGYANIQDDLKLFRSREHLWTDHPDGRDFGRLR